MSHRCLFWFRHDLRLADNPGLSAALTSGKPLILLFHREPDAAKPHGGAARWWLQQSLQHLSDDIAARGGKLLFASRPLPELIGQWQVDEVHWNRRYDPDGIARDSALKEQLRASGVAVTSHNASLLVEPWEIQTGSGGPYRVFTPFWKALRAQFVLPALLPAPSAFNGPPLAEEEQLADWGWQPQAPDWSVGLAARWSVGEAAAQARLDAFIDEGRLERYAAERNLPSAPGTSRLSPHLRHGELSPRQVWSAVQARFAASGSSDSGWTYLSELAWREFSYHLLYHFPQIGRENFNPAFERFPWRTDPEALRRWQRGLTGYPLVDAGMRELWHSGWMHNRVRMVVGSFLVKHLLIDWRAGEHWFWDCLVDADPASNAASWQWVAGSGADAAPYFRIFNPITQGEKFAAEAYVRRWLPEVADRPDRHLFDPEPPGTGSKRTKYPEALVEHAKARHRALDAYQQMKAPA